MVIVSKYRLERNEEKDILVISEEDTICTECGFHTSTMVLMS